MKEKRDSIDLRIIDIKELSFSNKVDQKLIEVFDNKNLKFDFGFSIQGNEDKDQNKAEVDIKIQIDFKYKLKDTYDSILKISTSTIFHLSNYTKESFYVVDNEDESKKQYFVTDDLMMFFLENSVGAIRGMISYKTASLPINFTLPLIDLKKFILQQ